MRQKTVDVFHGIFNDPFVGCLSAILLTYSCKVLAGYAQLAAVKFQLSWLYIKEVSSSMNCMNSTLLLDM